MKKRYVILAALLVTALAAAGCGKKQTTETEPVQATATPTPEVTKAVDMVDMQQTSDEDIKNVIDLILILFPNYQSSYLIPSYSFSIYRNPYNGTYNFIKSLYKLLLRSKPVQLRLLVHMVL